jgi:GntR family transcriptional regulator
MPIPMSRHEIVEDLQERIVGGEYPPGSQLPTYPELAELYGVSVSTMQRVVDTLKERGLVVTSPGRGLFVPDELP